MSRGSAVDNGSNVFHSLAALGQPKLVLKVVSTTSKKVVATGLSAKDKSGRTPLHVAAYCGNIKVLKTFLDVYPEAADVRDADGNNARDALQRPKALPLGEATTHMNFQRLVCIDKLGFAHQDFEHGPMDVWDLSVSNNSIVVVTQPTWDGIDVDRQLYATIKGDMRRLNLGTGNIPRYVATSNVHSLVLTADKCFSWGKNINGVLGLDSDEKIITEPKALDEQFVEFVDLERSNAFSALGRSSASSRKIKNPLIGVACCDFYSLCYTTVKIWSWGVNRGQMMNKAARNAVVETPIVVFETTSRITTVKCCDNAVCVLLSNGQVHLLQGSRVTRLQVGKSSRGVQAIAASGDHLVVQTDQGKLIRYYLKQNESEKDDGQVLWTPRKPKDEVVSFDVADNGSVVVATRSSVVKLEEGREISEFRALKGVPLTMLKTDPQCRALVGVAGIAAGLSYGKTPRNQRKNYSTSYIRWECVDDTSASSDGDLFLSVGNSTVCVHRAVLFARCPLLRPLITELGGAGEDSASLVAISGSSIIFRKAEAGNNSLVVEYASIESVSAFVASLYYSMDEPNPSFESYMQSKPLLLEFNALQRLITCDLGEGMWSARAADIGCDVKLESGLFAHSSILAAASPVIAAQLRRWSRDSLDDPASSAATSADILRYAYTMTLEVPRDIKIDSEKAEWLFTLWQVADELLMQGLSRECERRLFEMVNLEYVLPFLQACTPFSPLYSSLIDILVRNLPFFIAQIGDLTSETLEAAEKAFKTLEGTEAIDKDLAESYDILKSRLQYQKPSPSGKKSRQGSGASSQHPTQLEEPTQPTGRDKTVASTDNNGANAGNRQETPTGTSSVQPQKAERQGGWIQARRKSRPQGEPDKASISKPLIASPPRSSTSSPLPSLSPFATGSLTPASVRSQSPARQGPSSSGSPWSSTSSPQVGLRSSSSKASPSRSSSINPEQPAQLSDSLPSLGAKPRAASSSKGPRPKFNQKKVKQFDSPLLFAENLSQEKRAQTASTPWKQISNDTQTSQSVLEELERTHQINNRRFTGGSVWGI